MSPACLERLPGSWQHDRAQLPVLLTALMALGASFPSSESTDTLSACPWLLSWLLGHFSPLYSL